MKKMVNCALFVLFLSCNVLAEEIKPIQLSQPDFNRGKSLMLSLKERQSRRQLSSRDLPLDLLSNLMWSAYGVNRPESGGRTAPSAVNWQEIDIYVAMPSGLYLYEPKQNFLNPVISKDIREFAGKQAFVKTSPVVLIYVANLSKMSKDAADRSFYSAVDTGYISQNVYLFCASEGLATVVLGWVDKEGLAKVMNLRDDQKVILTQPVGYPE